MSQIHFVPWVQPVRGNMRLTRIFLVIIIVTATLGCIGTAAADLPSNQAKTQVLIYIVGSDLESQGGTGTQDIGEIVTGYGDTDPKTLDVVVAFGGAKKSGWEGMKIATMDDLKRDALDGKFGNSQQYAFSDPSADMGSVNSLVKFVSMVQASRPADRTIIILNDHGASYYGIGPDENTDNALSTGSIDTALGDRKVGFDPIMFDACLMGSIEVAKIAQPHTSVLLTSEEIEWGGYDYAPLIRTLIQNPDSDSATLSRVVADSFIDTRKDHPQPATQAVIDTTKIPAIVESLDSLGAKLVVVADTDQGLYDLKGAYNDAIQIGKKTKESKAYAVDLISLLENIQKKRPELSTDVQNTISLVRSAVSYERHNQYSAAVSGLSIASPDALTPATYRELGAAVKIAPNWDQFFEKMISVSNYGTSRSPTETSIEMSGPSEITDPSGNGKISAKASAVLIKPGFVNKGNGTFELKDPYHNAEVLGIYYRINGTDALEIGTQLINPDARGLYQVPEWDGRWYYFPNTVNVGQGSFWDWFLALFSAPAASTTSAPLLVDLEYGEVTSGGHTTYDSLISLQNQTVNTEAILTAYTNQSRGTAEIMITPYTITNDDYAVFRDGTERFEPGTRVTSYALGFNIRTRNTSEYTLSSTTAGPDMTMKYAMLPDGTYAIGILAYYDNEDEVLADQFRIITISNGAVVSSAIGPLIRG
jgi:hypothetical protein